MSSSSPIDFRPSPSTASRRSREKSTTARRLTMAGYLCTPPAEHSIDSFIPDSKSPSLPQWQAKLPPIQTNSPPASPTSTLPLLPSISTATGFHSHDEPLYPDSLAARSRSHSPLFATPSRSPATGAGTCPSIRGVMQGTGGSMTFFGSNDRSYVNRSTVRLPSVESDATSNYSYQPSSHQQIRGYYQDRVHELEGHQKYQLPKPRSSPAAELDPYTKQQIKSLNATKNANVSKRRQAVAAGAAAATRTISTRAVNATRVESVSPEKLNARRKRAARSSTLPEFFEAAYPPSHQQTTKHRRAPPTKKVDDVNWTDIEDFSPPSQTLDAIPKGLRATWDKGNPLDLSGDSDGGHCHPSEVQVASILRLSCAQYLTSKRRIFKAKVQALKEGKSFTKTAAQNNCCIDVNKASKLWEAFNSIGWFDEQWFKGRY